ncbi:MAG: copper resistance system multicopper oxidase [Bdellovibrionales bacterium]|nr:copper resistance system multicopper oxidase [Bdellovibrionales bacterium]
MVLSMNRRQFLAAGTSLLAAQLLLPSWARSAEPRTAVDPRSASTFDLVVGRSLLPIDGKEGSAITVNGTLPAPLLRWREGEEVTLRVTNNLEEDTSIHWHGILLPFQMDGVPGVTFPGIRPGETFTYHFPVRQSGTYWYHSHSGLQEQLGHYGPLIIDPKGTDPIDCDREYVVVFSDWTFTDPYRLFAQLKKEPESLNYQRQTVADLLGDMRRDGVLATLKDRWAWGEMRMAPTDISDVGGSTYTYLVNGHGPGDNWTGLFEPGERIRLRIINASAMTIFNVRIPGLPMTVVQADGLAVRPLEVDEFQIGVAETYDVIVSPREDVAYTVFAETIDRSGFARGTLAPRLGMVAEVPPLRKPPLLTHRDMGMASHHGHGATHHQHHGDSAKVQTTPKHSSDDARTPPSERRHSADPQPLAHPHPMGPGVSGVAEMGLYRLDDPGLGLEDVSHRVLTYSMLRSLEPNPDTRKPEREIELHLTSNMERYMWSFDGVQFAHVKEPIVFHEGERLRLTLVNDTMMSHPIHLHGMFFDVVNGGGNDGGNDGGNHMPRKHTIIVKPAEKVSVDITAEALGDWAFHCHLLYHMHAGMMQVVSVRPQGSDSVSA